jgi:hypothetical protein
MKLFNAPLPASVAEFLASELSGHRSYLTANARLQYTCGVTDWFASEEEFRAAQQALLPAQDGVTEDRTEYGDFQTNDALAQQIVRFLASSAEVTSPSVIVEPTCGKGALLLAALRAFPEVKRLFGVEIHEPYVWEAKFSVLAHFLAHPDAQRPRIHLVHADVFSFPFQTIRPEHPGESILVLGNPPWVTNAQLGSLDSENLPSKSNFKGVSGLDAMTGKGNFDLGESVVLRLLEAFKCWPGQFAMLLKRSVIRNLVHGMRQHPHGLGQTSLYRIDARKEFNAAVEAALFMGRLGAAPAETCREFELNRPDAVLNEFGWVADKFVAQVPVYQALRHLDGNCPVEWRQGIKHDCSSVMELKAIGGAYENALGDSVRLEPELVYGLLKSSDLQQPVVTATRRFVIVPQQRVGQDTQYLQDRFPQTYRYLQQHRDRFAARKSSIYRGKPAFSIFGIGAYSFKPFKVALSGLYKTPHFALIEPLDGKPVMLDDTCYFLGFDHRAEAVCTWLVLNHALTRQLLAALAFPDAKRPYTKELLMRLNLSAISCKIDFPEVEALALAQGVRAPEWRAYQTAMQSDQPKLKQLILFG